MKKNNFKFFSYLIIVPLLVFGIIIYPSESILAAKTGLDVWVNILIPSLLPFVILANLIVSLGIADFIGIIINPITRLIFNVSGKSALVFVISSVSGYPVGAKLASELRLNNEISKSEAQRLVSFCSTSGPLFIIGSVATGMFSNPNLGYLMIFCHYLASLSIGLLFRGYGSNEKIITDNKNIKSRLSDLINNSNNNFFVCFGNSVYNGVNTLLTIGGFVIAFSVIFKVLSLFNIISIISSIIYIPLSILGISKDLCFSLISGLFEMTIGCNNISNVLNSSEILKASLASFLIGFSGLSILAQCCNFIAKTDISTSLYILCKVLHGVFAGVFTFLLYPLLNSSSFTYSISNTFNIIYDNPVSSFYMANYNSILPIIFIIYIIATCFTLSRSSNTYQ